MAAGTKEYYAQAKGLITEANALTYPENATIDEDNFVLNRDSSRQRRKGMDYEGDYTLIDTALDSSLLDNASVTTFRWDNVNNDPTISIGIIQVYNKLWFVDLFKNTLSSNLLNSGAALTITGVGNDPIQFDIVNGVAVGVNKNIDMFYLEYDDATDSITKTDITLEVRDIWGVDDGLDVNYAPRTLAEDHTYNLANQGWGSYRRDTFFTTVGYYPSNASIEALGVKGDGNFDPWLLNGQNLGNTPAPKGKWVIDAFDRGNSRNAAKVGYPSGFSTGVDIEHGRPSVVLATSQRVFYSGITSNREGTDIKTPDYSGAVFFTKIISRNDDLGVCYQDADPSSANIFDIIDTDGGYIPIPEASNILKLEASENSIIVIAENGIWEIYNDTGGFTATSYQVSKVTNIGATSAGSVVNAEGNIYYWSKGGIYVLTRERVSTRMVAQNITEETIQTFYNNIQSVAKTNVVGNFDSANRRVSWLYNDTEEYDGVVDRNKYNKELHLNTILNAFNPYSISSLATDSPYVAGYMSTPNFVTNELTQNVVANGVQVQVDGEDVIVSDSVRVEGSGVTKYLIIKPNTDADYDFTFGQYQDENFLDWYTDDNTGADFTSYLQIGHELFGEGMRYKQTPYIIFHFQRTEMGYILDANNEIQFDNPSSCLVQARWDFSDHTNSGKYGTQFQAYRLSRNYIPANVDDEFNYGQSVITTKTKLRGRGRALSLYISSETGKDMHILGWGLNAIMQDVV